jgi:hypothetical protein
MEYESEIEFFGFVPVTFVAELQEEAEKILEETVKQIAKLNRHKGQKISQILHQAFKKNFFIFSNFVLRNILKFPQTFRPDRKASDIVLSSDLQKLTDELAGGYDEEEQYKDEICKRRVAIGLEKYRRERYLELLGARERIQGLIDDLASLNSSFKDVSELCSRLAVISDPGDEDLNALLEYRVLKGELAKKERNDLLLIGSDETLALFNEFANAPAKAE